MKCFFKSFSCLLHKFKKSEKKREKRFFFYPHASSHVNEISLLLLWLWWWRLCRLWRSRDPPPPNQSSGITQCYAEKEVTWRAVYIASPSLSVGKVKFVLLLRATQRKRRKVLNKKWKKKKRKVCMCACV